jgi:hypothetical protein
MFFIEIGQKPINKGLGVESHSKSRNELPAHAFAQFAP